MEIEADRIERTAFILKTIAHPVRLKIIELLRDRERMTVGELCEALNCEQSLTSHHLSNMKLKGILSSKREGKNMYYSLKEKDVTNILDCLKNCGCNMG
ncbi:ArsR/SmtB family transcription factor [Sediminitomix flava]|uniref:ArsR family transcriptional regulator n=1 Tax=Sediminitomix flava TaxID=379075 RepID=A0A315Z0M2_SEDFL|nr:metalloregulator ArsR/SmtB family transcription factor [Sediminitomix flava]PWJ36051.1 ArsR family transcriptional regulator [Sediminitomix flava]